MKEIIDIPAMGEALLVRFGMADGEVMVDAHRVDARATQGVALQVQRLGAVGLGDPSVTDQPVSQTRVWDMGVSMTLTACPVCTAFRFVFYVLQTTQKGTDAIMTDWQTCLEGYIKRTTGTLPKTRDELLLECLSDDERKAIGWWVGA